MKKIAVISQNKTLARFVELEVISCRFNCDVFLKPPTQFSEYSVVIVDTDSVDLTDPIPRRKLINIGNNKNFKQNCFANLPYPFILNEFRYILNSCVENDKKLDKISDETSTTTDIDFFSVNIADKTVFAFGEKMSVSEYELLVLERLCETPGAAVSRKELSDILGANGDTNIADVYVCHLRKKFERLTDKKIIYTVRSKGYMTNFSLIKE